MKQMTCIVCPVGCHLNVDEHLNVVGNRCPRGKEYAIIEMTSPKRMLTTTVKTSFLSYPRLSVKTRSPIPKAMIFEILDQLNQVIIKNHVKIGDIIISNICDTGVDVIATKSIPNHDHQEGIHEIHPSH